jgi:hypothetical protein
MATGPMSTLERRLARISGRLTKGVEGLMAAVIEEIGIELVGNQVGKGTPVDTGFARANWRPSLNAPSSSTVSLLDPSGQSTIARIKTVGQRWNVGDIFYLVNRADYIGALNAGHSPQAAPGFVQKAVLDGRRRGVRGFNILARAGGGPTGRSQGVT